MTTSSTYTETAIQLAEHMKMLEGHSEDREQMMPKWPPDPP